MATNNNQTYYHSFSGADITAYIEDRQFGTIQAISYSVSREKGPIYAMIGSPDVLAYARGKRAVAGSLIFLMIDKQAFLKDAGQATNATGNKVNKFYAHSNEVDYKTLLEQNQTLDLEQVFQSIGNLSNEERDAWYADQVMPFDIHIVGENESGKAVKRVIYKAEILNEGGGVSVDDLVIEESYTFVARGLSPWTEVSSRSPKGSSGNIVV